MQEIEKILKATLGEIEKILNTRGVVGEPIIAGDTTIIPLSSIGFGFGAGSGTGKEGKGADREGSGGGSGGGGGIKPVAVIVISKEGVRVEPLRRAGTDVIDKVAEIVARTLERRSASREDKEKEGEVSGEPKG